MDRSEKNRKLTAAEQRRLAHFTEVCSELESKGYKKTELTIGIVKANVVVLIAMVPLFVIGIWLYLAVNEEIHLVMRSYSALIILAVFLVLTPVHELLHGITWACFAENHFEDIEFGFMKEFATPYCTCKVPLSKGAYIIGALMPLIVLGVVPSIIGIATGRFLWLIIGLLMILAAGGDIMIVLKMIFFRSDAPEVLYYDHPTQAGMVVFEKMPEAVAPEGNEMPEIVPGGNEDVEQES